MYSVSIKFTTWWIISQLIFLSLFQSSFATWQISFQLILLFWKTKNKHSIYLSFYPEWLRIALYKDSRFPAHEMVFLRYFAMFGKRYGDVYRHALPSVIAKLGEANLAKYTYTGKREEKEWKNFFFKNDVVLNSWNSTSMNLHPRAITLQLNFSENNCSGEGREREKGSASRAAFSPISDF